MNASRGRAETYATSSKARRASQAPILMVSSALQRALRATREQATTMEALILPVSSVLSVPMLALVKPLARHARLVASIPTPTQHLHALNVAQANTVQQV